MTALVRIGATRDLCTQPLYRTLSSSSGSPGELLFETPAVHIDALMSNERTAAVVAPVDYAQNSSDMVIYPKIGVASSGASGLVRLYLRKHLAHITTLAVGAVTATDVVLARIVLAEKYDAEPSIVPVAGTVDEMLAKADVALVSGDALFSVKTDAPFIDLVDEWFDITELPFVHALCIGRSGTYSADLAKALEVSQDAGRLSIAAIAEEQSVQRNIPVPALKDFLTHFSYGFGDLEKLSLEEFFRMAFYHGMLGDIPEITFPE